MIIEIKNLSKSYKNNNGRINCHILQNINLSIPEGQFVCVLGPSGCGKTTLLNLLAGFIKPCSGSIFFNGKKITGAGPERAVVFQESTLFPWLTAQGNVEFGLRQRGDDKRTRAELSLKFLKMVGMAQHSDAYPHTLSGGMRQRVAIARVLALEPKALLMDEPFSALDTNTREHLQDELLRIWQKLRRTVFYVTHSVEEASYLADRIIIMGPAPDNIFMDELVTLRRPRERSSEEMGKMKQSLRKTLDALPCCIKPMKK